MKDSERVLEEVRAYLLEEFLPDEDPASLADDTALVTTGVLDSVALVKLVAYLEETYGIDFEAHEISADYLDTPAQIAATISSKGT